MSRAASSRTSLRRLLAALTAALVGAALAAVGLAVISVSLLLERRGAGRDAYPADAVRGGLPVSTSA